MDESQLSPLLYLPAEIPRRKGGDYLVFNCPIPQYVIRLRSPKVCPACLRESAYARKIWDLFPVTTCPLHQCLLLDECPNCMKRIAWNRRSVSCCQCEFDWREYNSHSLEDSELEVTRQIHRLCNLTVDSTEPIRYRVKTPLHNLELKHLLSALLFIASQFKGIIDTKGKHLAPSARNAETHMLLCKAWTVFETWPNNFFNFLNWRRAQVAKSHSASGVLKDFAEYKSALYKQLTATQLDFMRTAFEEYLANPVCRFQIVTSSAKRNGSNSCC